jgi:hypothetical protein
MTDYKVYSIHIEGKEVVCGYKLDEVLTEYFDHEKATVILKEDGYELDFSSDTDVLYIRVFTEKVSKEFDAYLDSLSESGFKFHFTDCKVEDTSIITELIEVI